MNNTHLFLTIGASGYIGKLLHEKARINFCSLGTSTSGQDGLLPFSLNSPHIFNYDLISSGTTVLLAAAISSPDICSNKYNEARSINVVGSIEFISKIISRGGRIIFFSSDTVYGECDKSFDETAQPNPIGEYAHMKREVEKFFLGNPLFKSIRLSYVFSSQDKFTRYLIGCVESGMAAEIFHPFYRSIIYREDVVDGVLALARNWDGFPQQVINFAGPQVVSRVDFAQCLKEYALPNLEFKVTVPDELFFKNRPKTIAMSSGVLQDLLGRPMHNISEAIQLEFS